MRIAIYARVSTDEQNVDTQVQECRRYCELKGYQAVTVFIDEGISGTRTSRPQFDAMLAQARAKQFDAIMVWRFDRASRSTRHLLTLLDDLSKWGVDFISIREQVDTTTAVGKMLFTMISAFAQFERDVISDRTKAAMQRLKREGKQVGRDKVIDYGRVQALKAQGLAPKAIAEALGISESHCRKIVRGAA